MAFITKTNGSTQPVFNLDVRNGSPAQTAALNIAGPVQPQGPKLDFFSLVANGNISLTGGANGYVGNVLQAIQNGGPTTGAGGTVAMYQVAADGVTLSIAIYPAGAYTTATLVAAAQTANAAIGIPTANVSATASFTTV
jgi:hypothetical protein